MVQSSFHLRLAELLSARLCHELISPVGAIANGVEILEEEPDFAASASQLIGQSAQTAARRLQFYRVAYGSTVELADKVAQGATEELFADSKIDMEWSPSLPLLPAGWGKLACNMVMVASEALPRGGRVVLTIVPTASGHFLGAIADGVGARLNDPIPALLSGGAHEDDLTARTVQSAFTRELAYRLGLQIRLQANRADEVALLAVPY